MSKWSITPGLLWVDTLGIVVAHLPGSDETAELSAEGSEAFRWVANANTEAQAPAEFTLILDHLRDCGLLVSAH